MKNVIVNKDDRMTRLLIGGVMLLVLFVLTATNRGWNSAAATQSPETPSQPSGMFSNPFSITIDDTPAPPTVAIPYPSTISVSGQLSISKVTITLNQFTHTWPDDVAVLLVAPSGAKCLLMADCGGSEFIASPLTLTFDDAASPAPDETQLVSGTFKPTKGTNAFADTNPVPADFPAPAPPGPYATSLAVFNGTSPNGTWSLYVIDDSASDRGDIFGGWSLTIASPTAVRMSACEAAIRDDGRVLLKWETGFETDNLGFNVYRMEDGERVRVNQQVIAGSALLAGPGTALTAGHSYRWRDTLQSGGRSARYWLEELDLNGQSTWHGPIDPARSIAEADFDQAPSPTLTELNQPDRSKPGAFELASEGTASTRIATQMKLYVTQDGYYRVSQRELVEAGFDPNADPRFLRLFANGREQPIVVQEGSDGYAIEFFGTGIDVACTDARVYQLAAGTQPGLRLKQKTGKGGSPSSGSFLCTAERRDRTIYFSALRNGDKENFFGAVVASQPVDQTLRLLKVSANAAGQAALEVSLQGVSRISHRVRLLVNGTDVGELYFEGQSAAAVRVALPHALLKEGDNVVRLIAEGGASDVSLVDAIRVSYWHDYAADDDALRLTAVSGERLTIGGFTNAPVRVLDITDAETTGVREVIGKARAEGQGLGVTFTVPGAGSREIFVFAASRMMNPAGIIADYPSDLRRRSNAADLVIITRREFFAAIDPLKSWRESQGFKVAVVDMEDIFDEFNNGNKSPQAVKDFLAYSRVNWSVAPRFVLLVGDASLDPKNHLGSGNWDLVPTKLIDTAFMETASDDWFADFDEDGLPEMAVGRLPVRTVEEASTVVSKLIRYDQSNPSAGVLLVTDSNDGFDFGAATSALRALIPGSLTVTEIDRSRLDNATAKSRVLDAINRGQKIVNYAGHGNVDQWRGNILTSSDGSSLLNAEKLSLFVSMTCLNGYFQDPALPSLGESLLKSPGGGAVAVWASSGLCAPAGQAIANQALYRVLLNGEQLTLGEAAVKAKASVSDSDIRRTWILLGDPTTKLR